MKRGKARLTVVICLLGLLAGNIHSLAQERERAVAKAMADVTDNRSKFSGSRYAFGKVVKGEPYSAKAVTESIQTLADGNQVIFKNETSIYRDSEGRTRLDQRVETIGTWNVTGVPLQMTLINDPVAGYSYNLDPRAKTAYKSAAAEETISAIAKELAQAKANEKKQKNEALPPELRVRSSDSSGSDPVMEARATQKAKTDEARKDVADPNQNKKAESLGRQIIEGVEAEGRRYTFTIPAGQIGNPLPIEIIDEQWYSQKLQVVLMSKHYDPRSGEVNYRVTSIDRNEPDRSLFEVPAGYKIVVNAPDFKIQMHQSEALKKRQGDF